MINPLEEQYTQWVYPEPVPDVAAALAKGVYQYGDPSFASAQLWPNRKPNPELSILVAGCGTSQAAFLAYTNPRASVIGIDLSATSLECSAQLKQKHKLDNLDLRRLDLHRVAELGRSFDLVVSTGVLHHQPDTQKGVMALAEVMADDGVMHLLLYGKYLRAGVYMVQEALSYLGLGQTAADANLARSIINALPPWHAVQSYLRIAPDLNFDGGIVDTFLPKRDRAFSVPEIMTLAAGCGLAFQGWIDNLDYYPEGGIARDHPVYERVMSLPEEKQWAVMELVAQSLGTHRFLLCKKGNIAKCRIHFDDHSYLKMVPARAYLLKADTPQPGIVHLSRAWHRCAISGLEADLFLSIDGKLTIGDLIDKRPVETLPGGAEAAREFFKRMWRLGHLYMSC
jgi:SAM-dependent methyltransferase